MIQINFMNDISRLNHYQCFSETSTSRDFIKDSNQYIKYFYHKILNNFSLQMKNYFHKIKMFGTIELKLKYFFPNRYSSDILAFLKAFRKVLRKK
jgi:hypothetical protein